MSLRAPNAFFGAWQSPRIPTDRFVPLAMTYYVYILTNKHHNVLYTGMTNNLHRRVQEHQQGVGSKFTKKYNVNKLVYYEIGDDVHAAIAREKQIKAGSRQKKIDLIESLNPEWRDLAEEI
jgi:putative endonuclease